MATTYPALHPAYGASAILNNDEGDTVYRVTGSDMPLVVVELALLSGRAVDDVVTDPEMRCEYARAAVQGIFDRRLAVSA